MCEFISVEYFLGKSVQGARLVGCRFGPTSLPGDDRLDPIIMTGKPATGSNVDPSPACIERCTAHSGGGCVGLLVDQIEPGVHRCRLILASDLPSVEWDFSHCVEGGDDSASATAYPVARCPGEYHWQRFDGLGAGGDLSSPDVTATARGCIGDIAELTVYRLAALTHTEEGRGAAYQFRRRLELPHAEIRFYHSSDGGSRLAVGGTTVSDQWCDQPNQPRQFRRAYPVHSWCAPLTRPSMRAGLEPRAPHGSRRPPSSPPGCTRSPSTSTRCQLGSVAVRLCRIVALYHHSFTSFQIHQHIRCLYL